jgi:hypothetical protein
MDNPANTVLGVVEDWLQAVCRKQEGDIDRDVDHAVWETFPASDPISPYKATEQSEGVRDLVLVVTADCIQLTRGEGKEDVSGPRRVLVGDTEDGASVRLEVRIDADAVRKLPVDGELAALVRSLDPRLAAQAGKDEAADAPKTPPEHA